MQAALKEMEISRIRFDFLRSLEDFFLEKEFIPLQTPLLSPALIPESSIEIFATRQISPWGKDRDLYLIPSPEIWMKKILGQWKTSIFQIGPSFRNSEQTGRIHNPEFTMLEWYAMNKTYHDNIILTQQLLQYLSKQRFCRNSELFAGESLVLTVDQAFQKWAGFSLEKNHSLEDLKKQTRRLDLPCSDHDSRESLFNLIMVDRIEPSLPRNRATFLVDYPAFVPTLSKPIPGTPWCERWELYLGQVELANCFSESTSKKEIQQYFDIEVAIEKRVPHKVDPEFSNCFPQDFSHVSGTALGVDRLLMKLLNLEDIQGVLLFPLL